MNFKRLDEARVVIALLGAVITGGAALYGVHSKARDATAASYGTLAPEVNNLKAAVERLARENAELRQALGKSGSTAAQTPGETAPPTASGATTQGRTAARRARPTRPTAAAEPDAPPEAPTSEPPAAPAATAGTPPPQAEPSGGVFDEIRKRVPDDFERAAEIYNEIRKRQGK